MSTKQVRYLAVCAAAVIAAAAILCLAAVVLRSVETPAKERTAAPPETVYRIIGEWEGKVAVYVPGTDMPETVYDTMVMSLPEEERQHLYNGIEVSSREALALRLEDYGY